MVSIFTPNVQLEEPARGDQVGTWDTPVNGNMTLVDRVVGAITTIALNNAPVVLAAAQYQSKQIAFNSTLTGSVAITFPTSFTKSYEIQNLCTGSSAFVITLTTTGAGGQVICCPPGETVDCFNDGLNLKFKNLGRVGSYWDYAGSSVPAWVAGCNPAPYLNCDGGAVSSATHPALFTMIGAVLPDFRGRLPGYLNQGTGRITSGSSTGGVDGNTLFASGGTQTVVLSSQNVPPVVITDPGHLHGFSSAGIAQAGPDNGGVIGMSNNFYGGSGTPKNTNTATTGITAGSTSPINYSNMPPVAVGGLRLIRAA